MTATETVQKGSKVWLLLLALVLLSNLVLYHTDFGLSLLPEEAKAVVLGSLFDFVITIPVLFMLYQKKFSAKSAILLFATGCVAARFLIPKSFLEPFLFVTWAGVAIESALFLLELAVIFVLVKYLPKIVRRVKESPLPLIFSFPKAVDEYIPNHQLIQLLCTDFLMFYYAFFSWKKKPKEGITLYKNSSYVVFQLMLIHAIVIETIGLHWWLHEKSMVLSLILLFLNVYSVIFLLGDLQAVRLNPVYVDDEAMYLSFGLLKRAEIRFEDIEGVKENPEIGKKRDKDTIDFIAGDFETPEPHLMLVMKKPVAVVSLLGVKKEYRKVLIRSDAPSELKQAVLDGMERCGRDNRED
ncbi:beta-carotene 15,15'-monooxygenase [Ureibacillus terrenus]